MLKKVIRRRKKERKKNTRVRYSTLTIFITTVTLNGTTIGDKLVETLYSNRVTSQNKRNYSPPLHSKLGRLLFSTGSSNSGTTLHGGNGVGKLYCTLLKSVKRNKAPFGRSVSTNVVATLHEGMGKEKLYYTLLKSVKRQKAPFGRSVSTNFVAFLLTLLLELIDTLDNLVYINVYIRAATMLCAYYPQFYRFSKCSKRFYILFLILSIYVF